MCRPRTSGPRTLKAIGWVSYLLHLIVAVGAVIPGAQPGAALLLIALVIDLVKRATQKAPGRPAIFLAPAHGDLGRCALCTDGPAVDFDPARLDRLGLISCGSCTASCAAWSP